MPLTPSAQSNIALNVRVVVAKPGKNGIESIKSETRFKNTATRLMTDSICAYLTGAENSYKRGKGRPNYMGFGTMGIARQNNLKAATTVDNFADKFPDVGERTRPWFESTSLALTTVTGPVNADKDGVSTHFWNPEWGWGKDAFNNKKVLDPIFQGELCTCMKPGEEDTWRKNGWEEIERIPILRADVLSDCPGDIDYGMDGYNSQAIFYGYASVEWVRKLLHPTNGPQLDEMAISEFGLYEKNNTDPHGLETMLAGFRVPTPEDIVYVQDGEVILVEWRVSVRAIMPYEIVGTDHEGGPEPGLLPFTKEDIDAIIGRAEERAYELGDNFILNSSEMDGSRLN